MIRGQSFPQGPAVVQYWGQNSAGAGGNAQKPLATYCDGNNDALILSFISAFNLGGLPVLNLANSCDGTFFQGTQLLTCPQVGEDIKTCQSKGVKILLSLGGASGAYGFQNDQQAVAFAHTLWNLFGKGSSETRPFGDAVIDGFDLDIEGGGSTGYVAFVQEMRKLYAQDSSKQYYMTAAPQCPFPDALLGSVINAVGFDAINVQFYNNYCAPTSGSFNFATWDEWAKQTSPQKNVKVYFGIPGSPSAAGSGYVPFNTLKPIVQSVASSYSSYGGVTVWDASQSYANTEVSPNYAVALHELVHSGSSSAGGSGSGASPSQGFTPVSSIMVAMSSSSALPTSVPGTGGSNGSRCVLEPTCSKPGQVVCHGDGIAICDHGKWVTMACPASTTCFDTTDGSSVYCGASTGHTTNECSAVSVQSRFKQVHRPKFPQPYRSAKVSAQLSVKSSSNSTFEAVINARRLDSMPFGSSVVVEFATHPTINVTEVDSGFIKSNGKNVKLQVKNPNKKSMALVFSIKGSMDSPVFIAPNPSSMKFLS
ncbi:chitinase 2 [Radiomyces spectabilis]|uniref:chitinase 2 n=1 Tax=Radiomyces spectabilis TaxID=64574 RepID=UPI0022203E86|nr:chitinase 2 [Radiomyces spectabilis]KAI8393951.1 chitinase 2 [Radiomyces spectabilis]